MNTISEVHETHWCRSESQEGFGDVDGGECFQNLWESFRIRFFDKDDEHRFINIEFDCRSKNIGEFFCEFDLKRVA